MDGAGLEGWGQLKRKFSMDPVLQRGDGLEMRRI
jgi:hypothetical protein